MKAAVLEKHGPAEVLKLKNIVKPEPGEGEVRVKIQSIGLNYAEVQSRKGLYGWAPKLPYTLGMEAYGMIDKVGKNSDRFTMGDPVIITTQFGTYAEYITIKERLASSALPGFSPEENAAYAVNFATAWVALFELARVRPDETVLIHAAAGGVGTAAVQLAKAHGCKVFGTVGSDEKKDLLTGLEIDGIVNYSKDDFLEGIRRMNNGNGVDVVLEVVGGEVFRKSMKLLNPFGRTVVMGFASLDLKRWNPLSWYRTWRSIPRVKINNLAVHSSGVMSSHLGYLLKNEKRMQRILDDMTDFVLKHGIKPIVGKVFSFEKISEAHSWIESRRSTGKVVVNLGNEMEIEPIK